jgi:AraC-like DNA-binding protein
VLEARRYLHYTDRSITEIAFALGYRDVAHFSKTFKRLASLAPQRFREQQPAEIALQR